MNRSIIMALAMCMVLSSCNFVTYKIDEDSRAKDVLSIFTKPNVRAKGPATSRDFPVAEFDAVVCNIPCEVNYRCAYSAVSVTGPQNVVEDISVYVKDRELHIEFNDKRYFDIKDMYVELSSLALNSLILNGAVDFVATDGGIGADDFELKVNGAAEIRIAPLVANNARFTFNGACDAEISGMDCGDVSVAVNGAADCVFKGKAQSACIEVNGAGDINVKGLDCKDIKTNTKGLGSVVGAN